MKHLGLHCLPKYPLKFPYSNVLVLGLYFDIARPQSVAIQIINLASMFCDYDLQFETKSGGIYTEELFSPYF